MSQFNETTYQVQGMTCSHCEQTVVGSVEALTGVQSATADHRRDALRVSGTASEDEIREVVQAAGYALTVGEAVPAGRSSCGCGC